MVFCVYLVIALASTAVAAVVPPPQSHPASLAILQTRGGAIIGSGRLERYLDKLFNETDYNGDGSISVPEAYELVLKMYVKINRQAPIPPPSKETVMKLFKSADLDKSGRLSRDEFRRLTVMLVSRATWRVVTHKVVKLLCAPLLAMKLVHSLSGRGWVRDFSKTVISAVGLNETGKVADLLNKAEFWRTLLTVTFVASLGNVALSLVDMALDIRSLAGGGDAVEEQISAKGQTSRNQKR